MKKQPFAWQHNSVAAAPRVLPSLQGGGGPQAPSHTEASVRRRGGADGRGR
jgi:hypothetical protein